MYLSYSEYQNMGGTLDETAFNNVNFEAESYVDWYTYNRLQKEDVIPETVKKCIYHIITLVYNKMNALQEPDMTGESNTGIISSQSNDGVSISYSVLSASEVLKASKEEIGTSIDRYLNGVTNSLGQKLLYRGIYPNE